MSLFSNTKLFLDLRTEQIITTPRTFALDGIVLDRRVAENFNLTAITMYIVKNSYVTNQNIYFDNSISVTNLNLLNENINPNIKSTYLENETSDFLVNKILSYSRFPGNILEFTHTFNTSDFLIDSNNIEESLDRITYKIDFTSTSSSNKTIWQKITEYYGEEHSESFKFVLVAYDEDGNLIDRTNIRDLGIDAQSLQETSYNEIISGFKTEVLTENINMFVEDNKFIIDLFEKDISDPRGNSRNSFRNYSNDYLPDSDPPICYYNGVQYTGTTISLLNNYPNLNYAFKKFCIAEDGEGTPFVFGSGDENNLQRRITLDDFILFGENGFVTSDMLERFKISIKSTDQIKISYISKDNKTIELELDGTSYRYSYDFSQEEIESEFIKQLIKDFETNETFDFYITVKYNIDSYIDDWNKEFTITKLVQIEKNEEFTNLIKSVSNKVFTNEIKKYFQFTPTIEFNSEISEKPLIGLQIIRTQRNLSESNLFNVDNISRLYLFDILQNTGQDKVSTLNSLKRLYRTQDINDDSIENISIDLTNNSFLTRIASDNEKWFELKHRQTVSGEINGELILEIKMLYFGEDISFYIPVDITNGLYLLNSTPYLEEFLPGPNNDLINFEFNSTNSNGPKIDFDINFNKQKLDNLSLLLLFGTTANLQDISEHETTLLDKLLLDIDFVKHEFTITNYLNQTVTYIIEKKPYSLKNFRYSKDKYIASDTLYKIKNVLEKEEELRVNEQDITISNVRDPNNRKLIKAYLSNSITSHILSGENRIDEKKSLSYSIKVKFRPFIFPVGFNEDYPNRESSNRGLNEANYSNLSEFNSDITNEIKLGLVNYISKKYPDNPEYVAEKWLTRNFANDQDDGSNSRYHMNSSTVKNILLGREPSYFNPTSTISDLVDIESIFSNQRIGYNLSGNSRINHDYDIDFKNNLTSGQISVESNISCFLLANTERTNLSVTSPLRQSPKITLKSDDLILTGIRNVKVAFIPCVINENIDLIGNSITSEHREYLNINPYADLQLFTVKIPYIDTSYSLNSDNKELNIDVAGNSKDFNLGHIYDFFNTNLSSHIIKERSNLNTDNLKSEIANNQDNTSLGISIPEFLLPQTFIVKRFIYRIKVTFNNGKSYYTNYTLPVNILNPTLSSLIETDPMRKQFLSNYSNLLFNQGNVSELANIDNNTYYNLAAFPYKKTESVAFLNGRVRNVTGYFYNKIFITGVAGYNVYN